MSTLRTETAAALADAGLDADDVIAVIRRAADEDLGTIGDLTSVATIAADARIDARYAARQPGVLSGIPVLMAAYDVCLGDSATLRPLLRDGDRVVPGSVIAEVSGDARGVLAVERLSLNLLGHLCGIATSTRAWVDAIADTGARIRDTRKTTPGLRNLEKYAVRCGGGTNHRRGLDDAVLIKDNHVTSAGGVGAALDRVAATYPPGSYVVQVEVDDFAQLEEALAHGAREILLDNFTVDELVKAVEIVRDRAPDVRLESSGGLRLDNAHAVASSGVDFLAVGALTHAAPGLDIGLDT
ncbi:MAG TPA: carboxylating nicotinate-nucleotide diphosphorylase [Mycobacteriales bacterium]|jgi:nicotinate-nucleotide pyrophosphorylase (carboxylating)|nr:carboxylating nicotinate-nucleotide diphosphorylase [Mycobacteriales bacterium]